MREEELDIRSSNKTIWLDGTEQQVLVRWYYDRDSNGIKIVEIINGAEPVGNSCSVEVRQSLCRQLKAEFISNKASDLASLLGNQRMMGGSRR